MSTAQASSADPSIGVTISKVRVIAFSSVCLHERPLRSKVLEALISDSGWGTVSQHDCLTFSVTASRPEVSFHVQQKPHAGGGPAHGLVSW
jgi:hypothetical protein